MKTIELDFEGYWISKDVLPDYKGIYCVYRATPHKHSDGTTTVSLNELIYIGKAEDETIKERHSKHEKQDEFEKQLKEGEELCYSTVKVAKEDIDRVENGLIFKRKPRLNSDLTAAFKHEDTNFVLKGDVADIATNFFLKKTE